MSHASTFCFIASRVFGKNLGRRGPVAIGLLLLVLCPAGCRRAADTDFDDLDAARDAGAWRDEYFQYAARNLNQLEQFGPGDTQQQTVDRLNQWIQGEPLPPEWKPDPLCSTLPEMMADLEKTVPLDQRLFSPGDGVALQEAVWLRNVSNWARGDRLDNLARAGHLFDWVVRNIQLEPDPADPNAVTPQRPWETLLWGRGTAVDRAWVYMLLLRHQGIDSVLLSLPEEKEKGDEGRGAGDADKKSGERSLVPWAVGVLAEGQLYLFDPALGLPIPAPDGVRFDESGQLDARPATLTQAAEAEAVLGQLDLDDSTPYPVRASRLKDVVALVAASPVALSARMAMVESRMVGTDKILLAVRPSRIAERVKAAPGVGDVRLWSWPLEAHRRHAHLRPEEEARREKALLPFEIGEAYPLWRGRMLHFKGELSGPRGATHFYRQARPADWRQVEIRESVSEKANSPKKMEKAREIGRAYQRAKADASYWLGLVASVLGNHEAAADYFTTRTLEADPQGPWTSGARYNLARLLEKLGRRTEAIELYEQDKTSPTRWGSQLRARWLKSSKAGATLPGTNP